MSVNKPGCDLDLLSENVSLNASELNETKAEETLYAIKVYEKFKMNKDPTKFKNIRK